MSFHSSSFPLATSFFVNFISDKSRTGKTVFRNETYWLLFSLVLKDLKELKIRKYSTLHCKTICRHDRLVLLTKEQMDVCFRGDGGKQMRCRTTGYD